jgi:hypothetical protein
MEFEHWFQQAGFVSALQMMVLGSLLAPGVMGRSDLYHVFAEKIASYVVTFGPPAMLAYILYKLTGLC